MTRIYGVGKDLMQIDMGVKVGTGVNPRVFEENKSPV